MFSGDDERRRDERRDEHPEERDRVDRFRRARDQPGVGLDPAERVREQEEQQRRARRAPTSEPSKRKPMMNATTSITANEIALRTTSLMVRPSSIRRRVHRQRAQPVDEALAEVLGDAEPGVDRAEQHGLGEDPGDHELLVVAVAGHGDRAAEHVHEQHHEHDRLQAREHQQLGVAGERLAGDGSPRSSCRARARCGPQRRIGDRVGLGRRGHGGHALTRHRHGLVVVRRRRVRARDR